jgi:hypothetical protein
MITINLSDNSNWSCLEKNSSIYFYPPNDKNNSAYFNITVIPIIPSESLIDIVSNQEEILQSQKQGQNYDFRGLEKLVIGNSTNNYTAYVSHLINLSNNNYIDNYYTILNDAVMYKFQYFAQNKTAYEEYKQFIQNITKNIEFNYNSKIPFSKYQSGLQFPNINPTLLASYDVNQLLYVYIDSTKQILVIDGESGKILDSLDSKDRPKKLLFDPINHMLYVSYFSNSLLKIFEFDNIGNKLVNTTEIEFNENINDFDIDNNGFHGAKTLIFASLEGNEKNEIQIVGNNIENYSADIENMPSVDDLTIDPLFNTMYIIDYDEDNLSSSIIGYHYFMNNNIFNVEKILSKKLNGLISDLSLYRKNNTIYALNFNNQTLHILQNSSQKSDEKSVRLQIPLPMKGFIDEKIDKLYLSSPLVDYIEVINLNKTIEKDLDKNIEKQNSKLYDFNNSKPFDIIYNEAVQKIFFIDRNSNYLKVFDTRNNKISTWITFKINNDSSIQPDNFGQIECNTFNSDGKIINKNITYDMLNKSMSLLYDNICEYVPNKESKYEFVKWEVNSFEPEKKMEIDNKKIFLNDSNLLAMTSPITVAVILENTDLVQTFRERVNTYGEFISIIGLLTVLISGIIGNTYYKLRKVKKPQSGQLKSKWILEKEQIFTIDGTIIVGVLIFLTISGVEEQQQQISIITSLIVVPFAISSILAIFDIRTLATILIISGMINLILAILILSNMSMNI